VAGGSRGIGGAVSRALAAGGSEVCSEDGGCWVTGQLVFSDGGYSLV
jgi:hypothetical protein